MRKNHKKKPKWPNRLLVDDPNIGRLCETRTMDFLGAELTIASGFLATNKSDGLLSKHEDYHFRIENKATCLSSYRVSLKVLHKITAESLETGRLPALVLNFTNKNGLPVVSGDWAVIPLSVFKEVFSD